MPRKAVVLSSGGLDSTTCLAIAKAEGFSLHAMTFDYGQRHKLELAAAERVAAAFEVSEHTVITIDLRQFGGSALTAEIEVPKPASADLIGGGAIPITYVPARNTIFLAYATAWAEVLGAADLFIGVNAMDYSGYPDCRPEFIEAFERMANLATKVGVEGRTPLMIHTPLISMTKKEIILKGTELGIDYGLTHSCYDPADRGRPCGRCEACLLRLRGFAEAGLTDPLDYQT